MNGCYAGVEDGNLIFGRMANSWTQLASKALPAGTTADTWYHLSVQATGCSFIVSAQPTGTTSTTSFTVSDSGCSSTAGKVGVRSYTGTASWRNVQVYDGAGSNVPYLAPFALGSQSQGWTTYGGSWATTGDFYVNSDVSATDLAISPATCNNCLVTGDVEITSDSGDAGFVSRSSNPGTGSNPVSGYYIGVSSTGHIVVQEETNGAAPTSPKYFPLFTASQNVWFYLTGQVTTLAADGCIIKFTAQRSTDPRTENEVTIPDTNGTYASGKVGLQSTQAAAKWRFVSIFNF